MASVLWAFFAAALGCLLVFDFWDFAFLKPRWAAALVVFGVGTSLGIGITSCLFFLVNLAIPGILNMSMWFEVLLLAWAGYVAYRRSKSPAAQLTTPRFPLNFLLMGSLVLAVAVVATALAGAWEANPHGNWDAWTIWNLRARFLAAGGELAHRTWSPMLLSHPEYPLLISAFVGRCWAFGHSVSPAAAIATSCLYLLALLAIVIGGVALLRSQSLGLLAGLALLGTPTLLHEVSALYADIPITCYFTAALVLMLLNYPLLAGLCASMAAWTKDEGLLFLALLFAATLVFQRRHVFRIVAGAVPVTLLVLTFKALLSKDTPSILGNSVHGLLPKLEDLSRYGQVIGAFGNELVGMSFGWYHPLLPVLVLVIVLRFDRQHRRDLLFCSAICGSLMLAYFATYIITPYDLVWHLQTSLGRLFVQLWPCFLLAIFVGLRTPESVASVAIPVEVAPRLIKVRKKTKASARR